MVAIKSKSKLKLKFRRQRFTELTDSQWQVIKDLVDNGRKRKYDLRHILNAILKITRTGMQWRNLDEKYPPWRIVYYYFRKWIKTGVFYQILLLLVQLERQKLGRHPQPSACAIDSQSVKKGSFVSLDCGFDGNKKINGRKRHIVVDTLGLPFAFFVSAANLPDGKMGIELFAQMEQASTRLELIRTDNAYTGYFTECATYFHWVVEPTQKPESVKGFVPQTGRWQVERSLAWLNFFRRLSKDYEKTVESSVAFMQLAFIDIIISKI